MKSILQSKLWQEIQENVKKIKELMGEDISEETRREMDEIEKDYDEIIGKEMSETGQEE
jgi:hypothetical protein